MQINQNLPSERETVRKSSARKVAAVVTASIVLIAGLGIVWWLVSTGQLGGKNPAEEMTTGLGALALVQTALAKSTSQSWMVFSDIGIASHTPYTPGSLGGNLSAAADLNAMDACASLPFTSIWNVSGLPDRSGNLTDGYAPFWQFLFENESKPGQFAFAIGVYVAGAVHVAAPLSDSNSCIQGLGLNTSTNLFPSSRPNLETNVGGPLAYAAVSRYYSLSVPYATLWTDGWPMVSNNGWESFVSFVGGYGEAWGVTFYTCGMTGVQPPVSSWIAHDDVVSQNGTPVAWPVLATQSICTQSAYNLTLWGGQVAPRGTGSVAEFTLKVSGSGPSASLYNLNDSQGVAAWMVHPQLSNSSGIPLSASSDLCPAWTQDPSGCLAPTAGWYAVLESPGGGWLDSFGLVNGSVEWAAPNVPIVSNESLEVFSADAGAGSGATFTFIPGVGWPQILAATVAF
jgi:hypothetical protein